MIKLIMFDLDGVLFKGKHIHYTCLNQALSEVDSTFQITWDEHLNMYDGLKTFEKLDMLTRAKGLPSNKHKDIWNRKQYLTLSEINSLSVQKDIIECMEWLSTKNITIACCSNSVRKTVNTVLSKLGIISYFDYIISNEDVKFSKPHPEMYWKAMSYFGYHPEESVIVEDSPYGLLSATRSGSNIIRVKSPDDLTLDFIKSQINTLMNNKSMLKWKDSTMNILIPMAGAGSRFEQAGYSFPKPLIDIKGKPMIQVVVDNLCIDANYIYVVQRKHREKYNLDSLLKLITPNCKIVETDGLTEGAACTALLAKEYINSDAPLFFANSDQYIEWNSTDFLYKMQETGPDGGIITFNSTHPKWSFVKTDEHGVVTEVAEKNPISNVATTGHYYWKHGKDFVKYAEQMINKNIRINNEFYVCPVFNEAINDKKIVRTFNIKEMWGLGTPEDLKHFLDNHV